MKPFDNSYVVPAGTRIGHIHIKVSDIERSLRFYCEILGFELTTRYGEEAAFISAGGYHHHIGLNVWYSKGSQPPPVHTTGLFHFAILYPERKDLASILQRLRNLNIPFSASDHGVSEAIYINDPDKNGIELYYDRPEHDWPRKPDGSIDMYTIPLDLDSLLEELKEE